jgi:hypothetical protein
MKKVIYRSLTGKRLGLIVPNYLNPKIHLCWSIKTGTSYYRECIGSSFVRENDWLCLCKKWKISGVVGLAEWNKV